MMTTEKMKTSDFLDKLSKISLEIPNNRMYVERGIQLIEWEGSMTADEKKRLDELKVALAGASLTAR
jgi:hypothetical protein